MRGEKRHLDAVDYAGSIYDSGEALELHGLALPGVLSRLEGGGHEVLCRVLGSGDEALLRAQPLEEHLDARDLQRLARLRAGDEGLQVVDERQVAEVAALEVVRPSLKRSVHLVDPLLGEAARLVPGVELVNQRVVENERLDDLGALRAEGVRVGLKALELLVRSRRGSGAGADVELLPADPLLDDPNAVADVPRPSRHLLSQVLFFCLRCPDSATTVPV